MEKKKNIFDKIKDKLEKAEQERVEKRINQRKSLREEALKSVSYLLSGSAFCDTNGQRSEVIAFSAEYICTIINHFEGIEFTLYYLNGSCVTIREKKETCFKTFFALAYIIPFIGRDRITRLRYQNYNAQHQGRLEDSYYDGSITEDGFLYGGRYFDIDQPIPDISDFISANEIKRLSLTERQTLEFLTNCWLERKVIPSLGKSLEESEYNKWINVLSGIKKELDSLKGSDSSENNIAKNELAGQKGEQRVEYALKWLDKDYIHILPRSGKKIRIINKEFIDEPQEFDHIIIGHNGVFLIETKNLIGNICIDENGNWIREIDDETKGMTNPVEQVRRHEKIIRSFIPKDVPVTSIICLANDETIVTGVEYSKVPLMKADLLVEWIESFSAPEFLDNKRVEEMSSLIQRYMI